MNKFVDVTNEMLIHTNSNLGELKEIFEYIKVNNDGTIIKYDKSNCKFDHVGLNKDEMSTIIKINIIFGWNLGIMRRINIPENVRCPDFQNLSSNVLEYWNIKGIYKSESIKSRVKKISRAFDEAKGQAQNIVIDLNRKECDLSNMEALSQLIKCLNREKYNWINQVILLGKNNMVRYYRRI